MALLLVLLLGLPPDGRADVHSAHGVAVPSRSFAIRYAEERQRVRAEAAAAAAARARGVDDAGGWFVSRRRRQRSAHGLLGLRRRRIGGGVPPRGARLARRQSAPRVGHAGLPRPEEPADKVAFARRWQRTLYDGGWAGLHWPREYGGRGATPLEQFLFAEEYTRVGRAADDRHRRRARASSARRSSTTAPRSRSGASCRAILTGDDVWCQGFSEPNAGSDLAACRTRAELDGDVFHVTGQKIWTSYARFADWCILVVRTDPQAPKHKGLTFLLVDMKSPGITIRPLVEMTGVAWFNEVFFDDVRVPRENMVGRARRGLDDRDHDAGARARRLGAARAPGRRAVATSSRWRAAGTAATRRRAVRQRLAQSCDRDRDRAAGRPGSR